MTDPALNHTHTPIAFSWNLHAVQARTLSKCQHLPSCVIMVWWEKKIERLLVQGSGSAFQMVHWKGQTEACLFRSCICLCVLRMGSHVGHCGLSSVAENDWNFRSSPSCFHWSPGIQAWSSAAHQSPCPLSLYTLLESEPRGVVQSCIFSLGELFDIKGWSLCRRNERSRINEQSSRLEHVQLD